MVNVLQDGSDMDLVVVHLLIGSGFGSHFHLEPASGVPDTCPVQAPCNQSTPPWIKEMLARMSRALHLATHWQLPLSPGSVVLVPFRSWHHQRNISSTRPTQRQTTAQRSKDVSECIGPI